MIKVNSASHLQCEASIMHRVNVLIAYDGKLMAYCRDCDSEPEPIGAVLARQ